MNPYEYPCNIWPRYTVEALGILPATTSSLEYARAMAKNYALISGAATIKMQANEYTFATVIENINR